ncbi:MAG: hypothetical protein FJ265_12860 [Planctomycetes bacterium]|nr:hypothetical protein [Planctomycetota bacterium]
MSCPSKLATVLLILTAAVRGQADNECIGATPVGVGSFATHNLGYTTSPEPWTCHPWAQFDRWFQFVPAVSSPYSIGACNLAQALDTAVEVYEGACGQLSFVACGDDDCGHFGLGDVASATLNAGRLYYIRVGTHGNAGSFTLQVAPGPGSLAVSAASGCGTTTVSFQGLPAIGSHFAVDFGNTTGVPFVGAGFTPLNVLFCTCTVGHDWSLLRPATSLTLSIPPDPALVNVSFLVQGADVGSATGCAGAALGLSDTWRVTIGV